MKILVILLLVALTNVLSAHEFLISKIVTKDHAGAILVKSKNANSQYWIAPSPIITKDDIVESFPNYDRESIVISLSDEAANKMLKATKQMNHGIDKLAFVFNGKVIWSATLRSILHKHILISVPGYDVSMREDLARKLSP